MTTSDQYDLDPETIPARLTAAGVAGAGGAGFPAAPKWANLDEVHSLMINHQESEPNYYSDKWLAREHADELADFFDALLDAGVFERVIIGTKGKYRGTWTDELEEATDATVFEEDETPADVSDEDGVVIVYTKDMYDFSEEQVLLMIAVGERIGRDLPTDHGWLVHNTESIFNVSRALRDGTPVTRKFVHVDGDSPRHRCLDVPVGTQASTILDAAGVDADDIDEDVVLADGGPGWCYEIEESPHEFGVRKRTNAVLVLGRDEVDEHTEQEGRINVLDARDWHDREHETEPTTLDPDFVRIPLITNAAYEGLVAPAVPVVESGDDVAAGDVVAEPGESDISETQHASIDGTVEAITETHVEVRRT